MPSWAHECYWTLVQHCREKRRRAGKTFTRKVEGGVNILVGDRQRAIKGRALALMRCRPQATAMRFDDRAADAQAHAHAFWLGGVERIEEAFVIFRAEPVTEVPHC